MPRFSPERLQTVLLELLPPEVRKLTVAYSGGLDSTVLLFALARIRLSAGFELRALHVDHQLQPSSAAWSEHCLRTAATAGVACSVLRIEVEIGDQGIEAAARAARYDALRPSIQPDEALLTAHHADDQLETALLALIRGAGVAGLSGAAEVQSFGEGRLVRPLMEFSRSDLHRWACDQQLQWIEDPTNESLGFDRNFLRSKITPELRGRWPSAAHSAVRACEHLREAAELLCDIAVIDAGAVAVGACLDVSKLRELSSARRRNLLRHWIKGFGLRAPSTRKLLAIEHDMLAAQSDRNPSIEIEGAVLRRHRDLLYCASQLEQMPSASVLVWDTRESLALPCGLGSLQLLADEGAGIAREKLPEHLRVAFRTGGESIRISSAQPERPLKKLLQESHVLPWWRARLPLIYAGDALVAVGDLWVDAAFEAELGQPSWRILWRGKPQIDAKSK